jgi:hypothetical protein
MRPDFFQEIRFQMSIQLTNGERRLAGLREKGLHRDVLADFNPELRAP